MKAKKILSSLLVALITVTSLAAGSTGVITKADTSIFTETFESTTSFTSRGTASTVISSDQSHGGSNSLYISGRTETWNGASITSSSMKAGGTYKFSAWLYYEGGSYTDTHDFAFNLQYSLNGEDVYPEIDTITASKGEWTYLEGEVEIPADAIRILAYLQTSYTTEPTEQDLMDFYIDDVTCVETVASNAVTTEYQKPDLNVSSLKDAYADYFKVGCACSASEISKTTVQNLILTQYNSITFENELKPDSTLNQNASISYMNSTGDQTNPQVVLSSGAKSLLDFCDRNNIPVRGHTLVWHSQTPDWFFKENYSASGAWVSKDVMIKRMENYIKNIMELLATSYPNVEFYAWDVVNEAFSESGTPRAAGSNNTSQGSSAWVQVFGDNSFIEYAFTYARKYAPAGCKLFYNDYNEYINAKRDAIYNLAKSLQAKNLIDGIGMQSHLSTDYPSDSLYETAITKFAGLGLEVQITELDITTGDTSSSGFSVQAAKFKAVFDAAKKAKEEGGNISAVILWGTNDETSWRSSQSPLIFDANYDPKPAFYSILDGMEASSSNGKTVFGDINCDGKVTAVDVIAFIPHFLSSPLTGQALLNADVLYNGKVELTDLATLKQYCVGDKIVLGNGSGSQETTVTTTPTTTVTPNGTGGSALLDGSLFSDTYENSETSWIGRGAATVAISSSQANTGSKSLFISGRTASWNGASLSITQLQAGGSYKFGTWVMYNNPSYSSQVFSLNLQYSLNGETSYPEIGTVTATGGKWAYIEGEISIPSGASDVMLYIQTAYTAEPTAQDLMDFYMDDVSCVRTAAPTTTVTTIGGSTSTASPMVQKSLTSVGNTARILKAIDKAKSGSNVTIAYIGGSITEGYSAGNDLCYAKLSYNYFAKQFGTGNNVKYVNAGLSGTSSVLGNVRAERDILYANPDVIFIEFAVNDQQNILCQKSYESLVKKCLSQPNEPAVVLLFTRSQTGYSCQSQMQKIGTKYNLPMISVNDALTYEISSGKMSWADYGNDQYHPHVKGHALVSSFIEYFYQQAQLPANKSTSYTIPSSTAYGADYQTAKLLDSTTMNVSSLGSFKNGTTNSKFPNGYTVQGSSSPLKFTTTGRTLFIVFKSNSSGMGSINVKVNGNNASTVNGNVSGGWGGPDTALVYTQSTAGSLSVEITGSGNFEILGIAAGQ